MVGSLRDKLLYNDYVFALFIMLVSAGMVFGSMALAPDKVQADTEPKNADVVCVEWAVVPLHKITRCEDEWTGEVCFDSTSGMLVCRFD